MEAHTHQLEPVAQHPSMPPAPVPETAGLRIVFRGYDMAQVDDLVASLVDEREHFSIPDPADAATRAGIERITSKTKAILMAAQQGAEELRIEAANEAAAVTAEADAYSERLRAEADTYAADSHAAADAAVAKQTHDSGIRAVETIEVADRESARIMREAHAERLRVEAGIDELREHRDAIVANLDRLRGNLNEVVDESHQGTYEWAAAEEDSEELDLDLGDFEAEEGRADQPGEDEGAEQPT